MKKIITTLAIAGMGAALAVGAQAQTFITGAPTTSGGSTPIYTLAITSNAAQITSGADSGDYEYQYLVTLTGDNAGANVNQITIDNVLGYVSGSNSLVDGTTFGNPAVTQFFAGGTSSVVTSGTGPTSVTSITYTGSPNGYLTAGSSTFPYTFSAPSSTPSPTAPALAPGNGSSAVFAFISTLAPSGNVSFGSNGKNPTGTNTGNLAGTGQALGPGTPNTTTVPETSSFALLGLGLLPLALVARRRLARNN